MFGLTSLFGRNPKKATSSAGTYAMPEVPCNVTNRVKQVTQPRGGYLRPRDFEQTVLDGGGIEDLHAEENVSPGLVGIAVDYLTRYMCGKEVGEAFDISKKGARLLNRLDQFELLSACVKGLDEKSIVAALKLSGFDSAYRAGIQAFRPLDTIDPDQDTIDNVRAMVERSISFFEQFGPVVSDGFTFEGGYTSLVIAGDGDFLTKDTLWDFKVSKQRLNSKQTLQLLMYWRMGVHSIHPQFKDVKYLGVYNPRTNVVYRYDLKNIQEGVIEEVDTDVIGY